jgi:hypothetical protein
MIIVVNNSIKGKATEILFEALEHNCTLASLNIGK